MNYKPETKYTIETKIAVTSTETVYKLAEEWANETEEHLILLGCDNRLNLIIKKEVASGSHDTCTIPTLKIFRELILSNCSQFFLIHNHPAGNPEPSIEDMIFTSKAINQGKIMEITLCDHIVVAKNGFFSIRYEKPDMWKI